VSWKNPQKGLVHKYAAAAGLADAEYRHLLYEVTGCRSARHPALTQHDFDHVMARLEALLAYRIAEGFVARPPSSKISDLVYWRRRLPSVGDQNSRQAFRIRQLWDMLRPHLPEPQQTDAYLAGMASRACGIHIESVWHLRRWQAAALIDALRDRLHYATRQTVR
jgi:hypothetical protein